MARLVVALDSAVGVKPAVLAVGWDADEETAALGPASVEQAAGGTFLPGLMELVVVPLGVNLASSVLYDVIRRLVVRHRPPEVDSTELELTETLSGDDRVVVVRLRRGRP